MSNLCTVCNKTFSTSSDRSCHQNTAHGPGSSVMQHSWVYTKQARLCGCYGQWQPSYFDMMRTMPEIEFNQGIPNDIDNADYLDVSQQNLIIMELAKYIPMRPEKIAKLSPEDRQEYENSLKTTKTPKHYALRSRLY